MDSAQRNDNKAAIGTVTTNDTTKDKIIIFALVIKYKSFQTGYAGNRTRTYDRLITNQVLYQLS